MIPKLTFIKTSTVTRAKGRTYNVRLAKLHPFLSSAFSNTALGSDAIYENDTMVTSFRTIGGADINVENWSFPVFYAKASDPEYTIVDDNLSSYTMRIPDNAAASGGTDAHMNVIQPNGIDSYEMWGAVKTGDLWDARYVVRTDITGVGMTAGARASGISHLHGLIRKEEMAVLKFPHSLVIAADNDQLLSGPVWPARLQDSDGTTAYTGVIPMGTMFAIPPSVDITTLGTTVNTPAGLALAKCLQDYGGHILLRAANTNLFAETPIATLYPSELTDLRNAWPTLRQQMLRVTNNTSTNVAGGGTRRVPTHIEVSAVA